VVYGRDTPARSSADIEALASLPAVRSSCLSKGKLALHEEFPDEVAPVIEPFLAEGRPDSSVQNQP
jgi:hypothetical protein